MAEDAILGRRRMIHCPAMRALSLFEKPNQLEGIMSKATSYMVVGVVAFVLGGFSFQLVGHGREFSRIEVR